MANQTVEIHSAGTATAEEGVKEGGNPKILLPGVCGRVEGVSREVIEKRRHLNRRLRNKHPFPKRREQGGQLLTKGTAWTHKARGGGKERQGQGLVTGQAS